MKTVAQQYQMIPMADLAAFPGNPRVNDVDTITESIEENGFYGAVLVQKSSMRILAGHGRYESALRHQADTIPGLVLDVDDERAKKIVAVDNRANDKATYDDSLLLDFLLDMGDLAGSGYDLTALTDLQKLMSVPDGDGRLVEDHEAGPDDTLFYPVIKLTVPPEIFDRWRDALDKHQGRTDSEKLVQLLGEIEDFRANG